MRIWSLHPKYLDVEALRALWSDCLVVRGFVLAGRVGRYTHRWISEPEHIDWYMRLLHAHISRRDNIHPDTTKTLAPIPPRIIGPEDIRPPKIVTFGQINHEAEILRDEIIAGYRNTGIVYPAPPIDPHPLFKVMPGEIESWETVRGEGQ